MFRLLALSGVAALFVCGSSASAQTIGDTAVAGLTGLCDAYLNLTPFYDAAAEAGFLREPSDGTVYFGPEEEVVSSPPPDALTCAVFVFYRQDEYLVLFSAIEGLALGRGMAKALDREHSISDQEQVWVTRWDGTAGSLRWVELKNLDGSASAGEFEVVQISIDR